MIHRIEDLSLPELAIYTQKSEAQLLHYYEPNCGIFIAESPTVIERALDNGYEPISFLLDENEWKGQTKQVVLRCGDVPVYTAEANLLSRLTGFQLTRGALCAMRRRPLPSMADICKGTRRIAVLEDVVNPTNIGAIFRSAAALNMDAILLTPGCCDPLYRRSIRVSMGTVFQIPWTVIDKKKSPWPVQSLKELHQLGFKTAAMALKKDSCSIDDPTLLAEEKLAIILGTEGDGLAPETIADCDYTVMIPMSHHVDSLNVAAASAVAFWQLGR